MAPASSGPYHILGLRRHHCCPRRRTCVFKGEFPLFFLLSLFACHFPPALSSRTSYLPLFSRGLDGASFQQVVGQMASFGGTKRLRRPCICDIDFFIDFLFSFPLKHLYLSKTQGVVSLLLLLLPPSQREHSMYLIILTNPTKFELELLISLVQNTIKVKTLQTIETCGVFNWPFVKLTKTSDT